MKKYVFMLLAAATLTTGFTSCGDDEKVEPKTENKDNQGNKDEQNGQENQNGQVNQAITEVDYSNVIGMGYRQILEKFGEPLMNFGGIYSFEFPQNDNVETITAMVNTENDQCYTLFVMLNAEAFKAEDLQAYFASKYTSYGAEEEPVFTDDEEEGEEAAKPMMRYIYGNAPKAEEATLLIAVLENQSIQFSNPQNAPSEEEVGDDPFAEFTPAQLMSFLGQNFSDLEEDYEDVFTDMAGQKYAGCSQNEWVNGLFLGLDSNGMVSSVTLFFDVETTEVLNHFEGEGWNVREGEPGEDGPTFIIQKGNISITFDGEMATASLAV